MHNIIYTTLQKKLTDSAARVEPTEAMIASAEMIFMMLELMWCIERMMSIRREMKFLWALPFKIMHSLDAMILRIHHIIIMYDRVNVLFKL